MTSAFVSIDIERLQSSKDFIGAEERVFFKKRATPSVIC